MIATAIVAFREFFEAFLITGVFIGISQKLHLKREIEIMIASFFGIILSLLLVTVTYIFGDHARYVFTEKNADILESYLMIFSGLFIAYVVFSLHDLLRTKGGKIFIQAHQKLQKNTFDISLFLTIVFLIVREGFEIALFTSSTSLFSSFGQNLAGLFIGLISSAALGLMTFIAYIKISVNIVYKITEYMIILLGAALVQIGITKFFELQLSVNLSEIMSLSFGSLPDEETIFGHLLQSFLGIDREFSLARLFIMAVYVFLIHLLFLKKRSRHIA